MTTMAILGALVGLLCPELMLIPMALMWGAISWTIDAMLNLILGKKHS